MQEYEAIESYGQGYSNVHLLSELLIPILIQCSQSASSTPSPHWQNQPRIKQANIQASFKRHHNFHILTVLLVLTCLKLFKMILMLYMYHTVVSALPTAAKKRDAGLQFCGCHFI